ncbi:MAG: tetratricopeptide repeat protein [Rhodothermales bacterium]|nr:tetratricopeptide repeat protein [Rhodothermales bacterium]
MDRLAILKEYLRDDPEDAFTRFAIASEYRKLGDLQAALEAFEGLVRDQPGYVGTYYHLAALYRELDRGEDARRTYQAGIKTAAAAGDRHAESELRSALLELDIDF